MSESLAQTTCRIHSERPASARCPGCKTFYCAECITEHEGKLTCAACLAKSNEPDKSTAVKSKRGLPDLWQPMPIIHAVLGLFVVWILFYLTARFITSLPDSFHEGTIWMGY